MTISEAATAIRNLVGQDNVTYANADILIDLNMWYQKAYQVIVDSIYDTDFDDSRSPSNYPIATRPLIAGQRDYAFSTASWSLAGREGGVATASQAIIPVKIRRVDLTYDGSNWYRATAIDSSVISDGFGNETTLDLNYASVEPAYDVKFNALWIYPLATAAQVSAGASVKLQFDRTITEFSSGDLSTGTATFGFEAPCHSYVVYGTALQRAMSRNLPQTAFLAQMLADAEDKLRKYYATKNEDAINALIPIYQNYN